MSACDSGSGESSLLALNCDESSTTLGSLILAVVASVSVYCLAKRCICNNGRGTGTHQDQAAAAMAATEDFDLELNDAALAAASKQRRRSSNMSAGEDSAYDMTA